ncbi:MAG: hypothetical protein EPO00_10945 [Chloroflexota bacterium]|nr:MAG: hypothetical protein EPO00_10945 [Chloroflexota bacterium]
MKPPQVCGTSGRRRIRAKHRTGRSAAEGRLERGRLSDAESALAPAPPAALEPLIATFIATFGVAWRPTTRRKHADDFARLTNWLQATGRPVTLASFDFLTLAAYVADLRARPKVRGVWRPDLNVAARTIERGPVETLSANSVNAYVRPLRSLAIWMADEGILPQNPFRRSRRRSAYDPLLPTEDTPPKGASLEDFRALERGCAGNRPIDLRDRAIVSILMTTAARNSSVRLLRIGDVDTERSVIRFRRAKGAKTFDIALHRDSAVAVLEYLAFGRPNLVGSAAPPADDEVLFVSTAPGAARRPLSTRSLSWMLTRAYHRGGGTLSHFGSHRIRHGTATLLVNNGMGLEEVSRYLGHSSTGPTRRYAQQTPGALGIHAADALARAGLASGSGGRAEEPTALPGGESWDPR